MSSKLESMSGRADTPFPDFSEQLLNPILLVNEWLDYAQKEKVREPRSMVLTTCNIDKQLSSRVIALLEFSCGEIFFATHTCSNKISDINSGSNAVVHFYWKELGRQLSICGAVKEADRATSEIYWNKRPVGLHPMTVVSRQSQLLDNPKELQKKADELAGIGPLPCPEHFAVYILVPQTIEFWASNSQRIHRRIRAENRNGVWNSAWLQP